jgi:WD40 repeat protein
VLKGHTGWVLSVAFDHCVSEAPIHKCLASGSQDGTVRVWNVSVQGHVVRGTLIHVLTGHTKSVNTVCFSPDNRLIISGSDDATVRLWDAASGKVVKMIQAHKQVVTCAAWSCDYDCFATSSEDMTVCVCRFGQKVRKLPGKASCVSCLFMCACV